jgi:WD40 repeat protein
MLGNKEIIRDILNDRLETWANSLPALTRLYIERKCIWPVISTCWLPQHEDYAWLLTGTGTGGSADKEDGGSCLHLHRVQEDTPSITLVARLHPVDIKGNADLDRVRASNDCSGRIAIKSNEGGVVTVSGVDLDLSRQDFSSDGPLLSLITFSPSISEPEWEPGGQGLDWLNTNEIASSCKDGKISLHNIKSGTTQVMCAHPTPGKCTNDCVASPLGSFLFTSVGEDGSISFCDSRIFTRPSFSFVGHRGAANSVSSSPCGQHIVSCGEDKSVKVWDLRLLSGSTVKSLYKWESHRCPVAQVEWSPTQDVIASADSLGGVFLWSTNETPQLDPLVEKRPQIKMAMGGHARVVDDIMFHQTSPLMASASSAVVIGGHHEGELVLQENILLVWKPIEYD